VFVASVRRRRPRGGQVQLVDLDPRVPPQGQNGPHKRAALALDSLHFQAEAERRAANLPERQLGELLADLAVRLSADWPPTDTAGLVPTVSRALHRHLLLCGTVFGLTTSQLAHVAPELADWYLPLGAVELTS
jgi:hypothetical protein